MADVQEKENGGYVEVKEEREEEEQQKNNKSTTEKGSFFHVEEFTLYTIFNRLVTAIVFPNSDLAYESAPLPRRIKDFVSQNGPLLHTASKNSAHHVLLWTRRGSPLRALLVVSVGAIALVTLTGLLVFMLFFAAATVNAIVISLLVSLAVAGGFLAMFFAFLTAIYIGALAVAVFVISAATISATIAVIIATGWIGFFWTLWLGMKKSVGFAKYSLDATGSVISAYSSTRFARRTHESDD